MKQYSTIVIALLLGICTAGCTSSQEPAPAAESIPAETQSAVTEVPVQQEEKHIEDVYETGKEQTICIFTAPGDRGTGFIYDGQYVITNEHVVYDTDDFTMQDINGQEYTGTVIYRNPADDIAVIKAEGLSGTSVTFGDSDALSAGDPMLCIGNPFDGEPFSYCTGKCLDLDEKLEQQIDKNNLFIHSDADLVSGYSGGPVFNINGEVIGIGNGAFMNDLSAYQLEHLSLMIPISRVREQIETACAQSKE